MDWAAHVDIISKFGYDPVVVLMLVRVFLSLTISALFFIEPRKCGGSNRTVHWILAVIFAFGAWSAWDRAQARMLAISQSQLGIPAGSIIWSELAVVLTEIVFIAVLFYQEYNAKTKQSFNIDPKCGKCEYVHECDKIASKGMPL